jgi:hypothetical protein
MALFSGAVFVIMAAIIRAVTILTVNNTPSTPPPHPLLLPSKNSYSIY